MSKEAMKLALEALENSWTEPGNKQYEFEKEAITALREALAEPDFWEGYVPEPVKPAQQEPVAFIKGRGWRNGNLEVIPAKMNQTFEIDQPLYTSPPAQRTWVGLVWGELPEDGHDHDFLRGAVWAEAKLKEKNT